MKTFKVGIIGFGLSGKHFHTPLLKSLEGFEITKVLTSREDEVFQTLPNAQVVRKIEELITNDIDLIINCAPNQFHYSYTKAAIEAGKNVVVEKPFVNTITEGEELISLAKKNNVILSVFQNRRWDGDFLTIKKLLSDGILGEVTCFESHFDRLRPTNRKERWREQAGPGSGIFYDLGVHLLDQVLELFGRPQELTADLEIQKENGSANDYFHVTLKYGAKRVIVRSSSFTELSPRFYIQGTKGNFIKYGFDPQEEAMKMGHSPNDKDFGKENNSQSGILLNWKDSEKTSMKFPSLKGNYLLYYKELYESLLQTDRKKVPVTPESALDVIKLIQLCLKSSEQKKTLRYESDDVRI
jgi:scyllo-inositol 2-dehydrogenase (NADP+)